MIGGDWRREGLTTNSQTGGGGVYVWPISSPPTHTTTPTTRGGGALSRKQAGCFYGGHNSDYRTGVDGEKNLRCLFFASFMRGIESGLRRS